MVFDVKIVFAIRVLCDVKVDEMLAFVAVSRPVVSVVEVKAVMFATGEVIEVVALSVSVVAPPSTVNFPFELTPPFTVRA